MTYRRVASLKTAHEFLSYLEQLHITLPFDEHVLAAPDSPLANPLQLASGFTIGNRFCIASRGLYNRSGH